MMQIIFPSAIIEPPCLHKSLTAQESSVSSIIYNKVYQACIHQGISYVYIIKFSQASVQAPFPQTFLAFISYRLSVHVLQHC